MSSRPYDSPPPYRPGSDYHPASYAPSRGMYNEDSRVIYKGDGSRELHNGDIRSQQTYSYFPGTEVQHFYKWSSPPGIIKILSIIIVVMSVGIFACVASTLPWDLDAYSAVGMGMGGMGMGGMGMGGMGYGTGMSGGYGSSYGSSNYGYGYGGNYTDPRAAKGFMLAMVAICFIFTMALFIISISRAHSFRTRKFYLLVIISCAILCFLMLIATIVYTVAINPTAQAAGSTFYNQIVALCSQFYGPAASVAFTNQYLYHYCVVEPQEAIAIVLGFLIVAALAIILFFSVKIRKAIGYYGKMNILWEKEKQPEEGDPNVEDWVNNVSGVPYEVPEVTSYTEKGGYPSYMHEDYPPDERAELNSRVNGAPQVLETETPLKNYSDVPEKAYSPDSDVKSAQTRPPRKRRPGREKKQNTEGNDTDYTTGAESCDELDEEDLDRKYPPIKSDQQRQAYKQEFDSGLQEYKQLQAMMDEVNKKLSDLNNQLDQLTEGSEEYQALAEEYNRQKDIKTSADYMEKKSRCKLMKTKLAHIKRMVSDYDSQKA